MKGHIFDTKFTRWSHKRGSTLYVSYERLQQGSYSWKPSTGFVQVIENRKSPVGLIYVFLQPKCNAEFLLEFILESPYE